MRDECPQEPQLATSLCQASISDFILTQTSLVAHFFRLTWELSLTQMLIFMKTPCIEGSGWLNAEKQQVHDSSHSFPD